MNGHDRRRERLKERIKQIALEMFLACGAEAVSMDEIADRADVSKVTIYKYFHSKEELHRDVFSLYFDQILTATEQVVDSDLPFLEKLTIVLGEKAVFPRVVENQAFFDLLEQDIPGAAGPKERIRAIMQRFYDQGVREGRIDRATSFEAIYQYYQIVQAGFRARSAEFAALLTDPTALDQLLDLFYYGFLRKD